MNKYLLIGFLFLAVACGDFKQEKFTDGPDASRNVTGTGEILDNLGSVNSGAFSLDKVLLNFGLNVMHPSQQVFSKNIDSLDSMLNLYCEVLSGYPEDIYTETTFQTLNTKLKDEWKKSMSSFHVLEAFKFGPITNNADEIGLSLYSWPLQNDCRIDIEIAKNSGNFNYQLKSNFNLRGLGALETILFTKSGTHNCPSAPEFLTKWMSTSLKTRHLDQCYYMKKVSEDLKTKAKSLARVWDPKQENFSLNLVKGKTLAQKLSTINDFSDSLFFVEKILKDLKLGTISGILNCKLASCPENTEHILSGYSVEATISNLKGFYIAFNGIDPETNFNGMGMDDYLINQKHSAVAEDINKATLFAIKNFESHVGKTSLFELAQNVNKGQCQDTSSENRLVEICALYQDVRQLTTLLKNDYILALRDIQAPAQSQGDMD